MGETKSILSHPLCTPPQKDERVKNCMTIVKRWLYWGTFVSIFEKKDANGSSWIRKLSTVIL